MFRVVFCSVILLASTARALPQKSNTVPNIIEIKELGLLRVFEQQAVRQALDAAISSGRHLASTVEKKKLR